MNYPRKGQTAQTMHKDCTRKHKQHKQCIRNAQEKTKQHKQCKRCRVRLACDLHEVCCTCTRNRFMRKRDLPAVTCVLLCFACVVVGRDLARPNGSTRIRRETIYLNMYVYIYIYIYTYIHIYIYIYIYIHIYIYIYIYIYIEYIFIY